MLAAQREQPEPSLQEHVAIELGGGEELMVDRIA